MNIGPKLKFLRKSKKITLAQLSEISGVQMATLSRIENGKMTGTLDSHLAIAKALEISIPELYTDIEHYINTTEPTPLNKETNVFVYSDKSSYEILTKNVLHKRMMPMLLKIEFGGKTNPEENKRSSEKFCYILRGKVRVVIEDENFDLKENHSLYFDASKKHHFINIGEKSARLLVILTPTSL